MVKRLTELSAEQKASLAPWADMWIEKALTPGPVDRASVEDGIRRCYEYAGIPWHGNVVWVDNPLVVGFAGPIAALLLDRPGTVYGAVHGAVGEAVIGAVGEAVIGAVGGAVDVAVYGAVHGAVGGAVHGAVSGAVHGAVSGAVHGAVSGAVHGAVGEAVIGAVGGAVDVAVDGAVGGAWYRYVGGMTWAYWYAYVSYYRENTDLELPGDLWDRARAYEQANRAGWWWPHKQFVIVSDKWSATPQLEQVRERGWGSHRLHSLTGPALSFPGWDLYYVHGVRVDEKVVMRPDELTAEDVWAATNQEVRRTIIDQMGWDRFVTEAGLVLVDECADPGNPGHVVSLYDLPERVYDEPVRVVLVDNATVDRDGRRRRFGLTVPQECGSALGAVAWTFDLDAGVYAGLERAT